MTWLDPPAEASTLKTTAKMHGPLVQSVVSSKKVSPSFAKMLACTRAHSSAQPVHSCTSPSLGPSNVPFKLATAGSPDAHVCAGLARPAALSRAVLARAKSSPYTASQPAAVVFWAAPSTKVDGASTRSPSSSSTPPVAATPSHPSSQRNAKVAPCSPVTLPASVAIV